MRTLTILNRFTNVMSKVELVSVEVQHPDSWWHAHNRKHEVAECNIQPAPSALKASVWKHFGFYDVEGQKDLDKSHTICKLCRIKHTLQQDLKPKSWNMINQYDSIVAFFIFLYECCFLYYLAVTSLCSKQISKTLSLEWVHCTALHRVCQCSRSEKSDTTFWLSFLQMFKCLRPFLYENCFWMWYTAKCLLFGLRYSVLRMSFIVRSLGLFIIYLWTRAAFYVVSYSEYAQVHKHYSCLRDRILHFWLKAVILVQQNVLVFFVWRIILLIAHNRSICWLKVYSFLC